MRRILLIVAMLLIAAPAMATVTVTATQTGVPCSTVEIKYSCSGMEEVRAFALDISVDSGCTITGIRDFNKGPSVGISPSIHGYGIFPGKFRDYINPADPCWTDANYNPVAPTGDPDANTGLGTGAITIELGSLYSGAGNAPLSSGLLCKIDVVPPQPKMDCNLVLTVNSTRGGVVDVNGDSLVKDVNLTLTGCTVSFPECFPCWQPYLTRYDDFVKLSKPDCWCGAYATDPECKYHCYGDANCDGQVVDWRVYTNDLTVLSGNWKKKGTDPSLNPCADVHYDGQVVDWRVYTNDLTVLSNNWKAKGSVLATYPPCPAP